MSRHWLAASVCILSCLASGCAYAVKAYPICQYNGPSQDQLVKLNGALSDWLADDRKAAIVISPDSKWAMVRARESWHREALPLWPAMGCIGLYASDVSHAKYAACLLTVREMLIAGDVTKTGSRSDSLRDPPVLFCNGQ